MNARLKPLLTAAETRLAPADQDALADLLEAFLADRDDDPAFTDDERAHLQRIAAEPFDPAPPEEVAALFGRRA